MTKLSYLSLKFDIAPGLTGNSKPYGVPKKNKRERIKMLKDFDDNVVTAEQFSEVENKWQKYWDEYCKKVPDADGDDYRDEREMFMTGELGGDFKHM